MNFLVIRLFIVGSLLIIGLPHTHGMLVLPHGHFTKSYTSQWTLTIKIKMPNEETIKRRLDDLGIGFFYDQADFSNKLNTRKDFVNTIVDKILSIERIIELVDTACNNFYKEKSAFLDRLETLPFNDSCRDFKLLYTLERNLIVDLKPLIIKAVLLKDYPKAVESYEEFVL